MFKKAPAKRRSGSPDPYGTKKAKTGEKAAAGEVSRLIVGRCSVADPVCLSRILDPNFSILDPGSKRFGIRIKEF